MKRMAIFGGIGVLLASTMVLAQVNKTIHEFLSGYEEDPLTISTSGNGEFQARINNSDTEIEYSLTYSDLEGNVLQSHIHVAQPAQSGGISVFLCTNLGNGPAGTQLCPPAPATITGTIRASDVIGPAGQGIAAGELAELISAIRAARTYVNVHTAKYPSGEIRANLNHRNP